MVKYLFFVVEEYDDGAPEPFGEVELDDYPAEGDIVTLRWLSGKKAHDAEVLKVDHERMELRVRRV